MANETKLPRPLYAELPVPRRDADSDRRGAVRRSAVFAVLVNSRDRWKRHDMILSALRLRCSAERLGSKLPFHLISALLRPEQLRLLESFGWQVENHTGGVAFMKSRYRPVYSAKEAEEQGRWWSPGRMPLVRKDGWATYFKFYAWRASWYDRVLLADLDICFKENPDPKLLDIPSEVTFMASAERADRRYWGINSRLMVLRPSVGVFRALTSRAASGEYVPYTNTEQDVLEFMFPAHLFASGRSDVSSILDHHHDDLWGTHATNVCNVAALAALPEPSCADFWARCVLPDMTNGCRGSDA